MKQTAVEWFYQRILSKDIKQVFEQAKAMEKEQIIEAFNQSWHDRMNPYKTAEKYYNKNLNQNKMEEDKKDIVLLNSRLEILNKYIDFSKDGVMEREEIIKAMQEYAELYYLAKTKLETFKSE